ncbi:MAG TPA: hypothetical protein VFX02_09840 [Gammaproteobacteria bacterium]|nr:hypothetical protein [Gammaproteobacteria bacterium]
MNRLRKWTKGALRVLLYASLSMFRPDPVLAETAGGAATTGRENITFIMGADTGDKLPFYAPAEDYYRYDPRADTGYLETGSRSLQAVRDRLQSPPGNGLPWGVINLVTHSSTTGIAVPVVEDGARTEAASLEKALAEGALNPLPDTLVDAQTEIHIQGCGIGQRQDILNLLSRLFGGDDPQRPVVRAPIHLVFYESAWAQGKLARTDRYIVRDWALIFPRNQVPPKGAVVEKFRHRYPDADIDWRLAFMNTAPVDMKNIFYEEIPLSFSVLLPRKMALRYSVRELVKIPEIKDHVASMGYTPADFQWRIERDITAEHGNSRIVGEAVLIKAYSGILETETGQYSRLRPDMSDESYFAASSPGS